MEQALFLSDTLSTPTRYPVVGTQKDIRYYGTVARGVLNSPESTGMAFWSINPYIGCAFGCTYCYARYAHRFVMERAASRDDAGTDIADDLEELPPWLAFERRIFVKRNAAQVLRRTLQSRRESLGAVRRGETIVIGTATDPYQPAERTFRITRELLAVLADVRRLRLVIITKSPLITRDVDLLVRIAQHSRLTVHLSLITLDRELARRVEPRAPTPEARLRALQRLSGAGLDVRTGTAVTAISRTALGQDTIGHDNGSHGWTITIGESSLQAEAVVLTSPVPQSLALLADGGVVLAAHDMAALTAVRYEPCLAELAVLDGPSGLPAPGAVNPDSGPIDWMADNQRKGISASPAVTIHATADFSREHWSSPDEFVVTELLASAGLPVAVSAAQVQRWRYARPVNVHPARHLLAHGLAPLVFAGDAFGGAKVEGAILSGLSAAAALDPTSA